MKVTTGLTITLNDAWRVIYSACAFESYKLGRTIDCFSAVYVGIYLLVIIGHKHTLKMEYNSVRWR